MSRPSWKGKHLLPALLTHAYRINFPIHLNSKSKGAVIELTPSPLTPTYLLHRRNQVISVSMIPFLRRLNYKIYNGYNFYPPTVSRAHVDLNLADSILTREHDVKHKVKVTKAQRKIQQNMKKKEKGSVGTSKKAKKKGAVSKKKKK